MFIKLVLRSISEKAYDASWFNINLDVAVLGVFCAIALNRFLKLIYVLISLK